MTLLDTSALLAHAFGESGSEVVEALLNEGKAWVAAPVWLEMRVRMASQPDSQELLQRYQLLLAGTVNIDTTVIEAAYLLRQSTPRRLPAVDSMIAGASKVRGFKLVHRDAHMARIPQALLAQTILPAKA